MKHRWCLGTSGIDRCDRCPSERQRDDRNRKTFRPSSKHPWSDSEPDCRSIDQGILFEEYVPDDDDLLDFDLPAPSNPAQAFIDARGGRKGSLDVDAHVLLGIDRHRTRPNESPHSFESNAAFAVHLSMFDDETFEFGILAEGVPIGVDMRWMDVSTETRVLRRCAFAMLQVGRELLSCRRRNGARAMLRNHTNGETFRWRFLDGRWQRS